MLAGFNNNVPHKGKMYHVQTEDSGPRNPVIITLLYHKGAIISSKKSGYAHLLGDIDWEQRVENMMKQQHQSMMRELIHGRYTGEQAEPSEAEEEMAMAAKALETKRSEKSLDEVLLEYLLGREK